jgi:Zn finger protein HypA/HybF involved in hydrogenase expression
MWLCGKCGEQSEDTYDVCWKCGRNKDGSVDPVPDPLKCARCTEVLEYVGRKRFHEGTNWGFFGELGELFVKREHFDVYVCPRCGRVEMFVDGIGEDLRQEPASGG